MKETNYQVPKSRYQRDISIRRCVVALMQNTENAFLYNIFLIKNKENKTVLKLKIQKRYVHSILLNLDDLFVHQCLIDFCFKEKIHSNYVSG